MTASLLRSAPISTAASRPTSGWPTMAACPPAAVTAATMLSGSDRAPDSTATVPRGNVVGSSLGQRFGERQQRFRVGQHVVRRHLAASAATNLSGYRRHLATQVFYLFSAVNPMPDPGSSLPSQQHLPPSSESSLIRMYVRYNE